MAKILKKLTKCECGAGRAGRPAQFSREEREALILDALEQVVAAKGLQGATMSAIARAAGMSKRTLYTIYEGRDALFETWVRRLRASFLRPLAPEERELPIADRLRRLLRLEAQRGAACDRLAVLRAVISEAPRLPDLARTFHREVPAAARQILRAELERAAERNELRIEDGAAAAALLLDMVHAAVLDRLIDPDAEPPTEQEAEARLSLAINIFLKGVAVDDPASGQV